MKLVIKTIAGFGLLMISGVSQASLLCSDGSPTYTGVLDVSDVTWAYDGSSQDADDCYGEAPGNDDTTAVGGVFGGVWQELAKADGDTLPTDTGSYMGVDFTLSADCTGGCAGSEGTYTLSWTDPAPTSLPLTLDFVVGLKGANSFGLWLFDDITINSSPASGGGSWEINWTNGGGRIPDISHLTIYVTDGRMTQMPEPSTLALFGLGLLGVGLSRRRRNVN